MTHPLDPSDTRMLLVVDCQATSSRAADAHAIEIAWCLLGAGPPEPAVSSHLVALPEGIDVPAAVTRLTGISGADLSGAAPAGLVLERLVKDAALALAAVAHVARFEERLLSRLASEQGLSLPLPFLCTHRIAARLLPDLPSRSLRAVAGRFGHPVPEARRAADHVRATVAVWRELWRRLPAQGVRTLEDLGPWLAGRPAAPRARPSFPIARIRRLGLTGRPGVYRMKDAAGRVLYVGKAVNLKRRVNGYFQKSLTGEARHAELLAQVREIEVTPTATATEAALLELDEIRRHDPPYNVARRRMPGRLLFLSRDGRVADAPGDEHPHGPLPHDPGAHPGSAAEVAVLVARARVGARRLCWLAESSVAWRRRNPRDGWRLLVVEGWLPGDARDIAREDDAPAPPGAARSLAERQRAVDPLRYERLRTLDAELGRLARSGRELLLVLGPGIRLDGAAVRRWMAATDGRRRRPPLTGRGPRS